MDKKQKTILIWITIIVTLITTYAIYPANYKGAFIKLEKLGEHFDKGVLKSFSPF